MIIRPVKSGKFWKILYESKEEAQAVADYQKQLLVKGVDERAEWPHEKETFTGDE